VEARLYAEDPHNGFLPSTGTLERLRLPDAVRVDAGVREGDAVTEYYDPMIAKVIAHASTRKAALAKLADALAEVEVAGLRTNNGFLVRTLRHPAFVAGEIDTGFIAHHLSELASQPAMPDNVLAAAAQCLVRAHVVEDGDDPWGRADSFRLAGQVRRKVDFVVDGKRVTVAAPEVSETGAHALHLANGDIAVMADGETFVLRPHDPLEDAETEGGTDECILSPMPGKIIQVHVKPGQAVRRGEPLIVLEAMKMEHTLTAPRDTVIEAVEAASGDQIVEGAVLVRFEGDAA